MTFGSCAFECQMVELLPSITLDAFSWELFILVAVAVIFLDGMYSGSTFAVKTSLTGALAIFVPLAARRTSSVRLLAIFGRLLPVYLVQVEPLSTLNSMELSMPYTF